MRCAAPQSALDAQLRELGEGHLVEFRTVHEPRTPVRGERRRQLQLARWPVAAGVEYLVRRMDPLHGRDKLLGRLVEEQACCDPLYVKSIDRVLSCRLAVYMEQLCR